MQKKSPVGSFIKPTPGEGTIADIVLLCSDSNPFSLVSGLSPGYGEEVIFADGTFIDGSTLELTADGPLREPYVAFTQVSL